MAYAPERPSQAGEKKPAGAGFSQRSLDLDVRSSAGPYPRPRPPRGSLKKTWLMAAGAAVILLLTCWVLLRSDDEPTSPPPPEAASFDPATAPLTDSADRPTDGKLDFAPVANQPEDKPESPATQELTEAKPAQATVSTEPADKPAQAAVSAKPAQAVAPAKPADKPAQTTSAKPADKPAKTTSAKPTDKPAQAATASAKPADKPAQAATASAKPAEQPAATSPAEKPGIVEISDKWVVNIYSNPDAAESLRFLSTLLGQDVGGKVYAYEAILEGRTQHRIRVGFFDTREEAEAVGLKIKERYQLYATPWAVRPSKEEESKYGGGR